MVAIPCRFDSCLGHQKKGLAPSSVPVPFFFPGQFDQHPRITPPNVMHVLELGVSMYENHLVKSKF